MAAILAIDAMGGDKAPGIVVEGIRLFLDSFRSLPVKFLIFGDEKLLLQIFEENGGLDSSCTVIHTPRTITNDLTPMAAIKLMDISSMGRAIKAVATGDAHGVVSAGNTGAYMALSKLILKTIDEIDRPAIPATIPSLTGHTLVLDLGANLQCTAQQLVQFARLGQVYAQLLLKKEQPRIGLLNIGSEEIKGHAELQLAAQVLRQQSDLDFIGFVEGDDITAGTVDVVVTDGFTGNVSLKAIEGTAKLITRFLQDELERSWRTKLGYAVAKPAFDQLKKRLDPCLYNGAVFLGLKHVAVKSHGNTNATGFAKAIEMAAQMVMYDLPSKLEKAMGGLTF